MSDEGFLQSRIDAQAARIEALEAALREIADTAASELTYTGHSPNTRGAFQKINGSARAALAPEQSKEPPPRPEPSVPFRKG